MADVDTERIKSMTDATDLITGQQQQNNLGRLLAGVQEGEKSNSIKKDEFCGVDKKSPLASKAAGRRINMIFTLKQNVGALAEALDIFKVILFYLPFIP